MTFLSSKASARMLVHVHHCLCDMLEAPSIGAKCFINLSLILCACMSLDLAELNLPKTCETKFPDKDDLLHFKLVITPDEVLRRCTACVVTLGQCESLLLD